MVIKRNDMINSSQRKKLRAMAHHLEPMVIIGKSGYNDGAKQSIDESLVKNELIKIKFNDHKKNKKNISQNIESDLQAYIVGSIGNIIILYKQNPDFDKRKISI